MVIKIKTRKKHFIVTKNDFGAILIDYCTLQSAISYMSIGNK